MITVAAIYIRLSLEDIDLDDGKVESQSITNQRNLLMDYIKNNPEFCAAEMIEFCDDGWSGKNFDRPGMKRLIEAAQNGVVNCIMVKDFSRLGRDYLAVGNYVSRVFPFLGVRVISVNDHFDSNRPGDIDRLDISVMMLINDMYSRDLSKKVLSAKKNLVERGVYINPVAPYGYKKDPDDKHHLIVDPAAGAVIHRIFSLVAGGKTTRNVARTLNEEQVATPAVYKENTPSYHNNWAGGNFWIAKMVWGIVRDRQYMGSLVWGKRVRRQIGVRQQLTASVNDWHVVDDHHDPIVSKELYEQAQVGLGGAYSQDDKHSTLEHPLRKKVFCGACGRAIVRKAKVMPYYRCATPDTLPGAECSTEKIYADEIMDAAVEAIRAQARYAVEHKHIFDAQKEVAAARIHALQSELQMLQDQRVQLTKQLRELYESMVDGRIARVVYAAHKKTVQDRLQWVLDSITGNGKELSVAQAEKEGTMEPFSQYVHLDELTDAIAADLLERVTIWPDGRLEISLNHCNIFSRMAKPA